MTGPRTLKDLIKQRVSDSGLEIEDNKLFTRFSENLDKLVGTDEPGLYKIMCKIENIIEEIQTIYGPEVYERINSIYIEALCSKGVIKQNESEN